MALRLTNTLAVFLRIIRWPNLVIVAGCLMAFHVTLKQFEPLDHPLLLGGYHFMVFVMAAICITASGYLINDHFDRSTDAINKPQSQSDYKQIAPFSAINLFVFFSLTGAFLSLWLAWELNQWIWFPLYPLVTVSLVGYALYLKGAGWWGNLWVALLSGSLHWVLILPELQWLKSLSTSARQEVLLIFTSFSALAFSISLFREIVKDMEDEVGDFLTEWRTGVVRYGLPTARKLATGIGVMTIILLILATFWVPVGWISQLFLVIATISIIRLLWLLQSARHKDTFHQIRQGAKWVLLLGLLAVLSL